MADNYLERKMEEHRMSPPYRRSSSLPSKGKILFNFPPKRILVCGSDSALSKALIKAFAESGCRVALYSTCSNDDASGARFIQSTGRPSQDLSKMLQSWGDVDVIISARHNEAMFPIAEAILNNRQLLPYPNNYGLRLIYINSKNAPHIPDGVICNTIIIDSTDNPPLLRQVALTALFLSVPEMSAINNSTVKIN